MGTKQIKAFNWVAKKGPYYPLCLIVIGLVLHIVGVSTSHWLEGARLPGPQNNADIVKVTVGLSCQRIEYKNWTVENTDSSLTIQAPQYVILAIACVSTGLCAFTVVRSLPIIVGTSGFIAMPLQLVSLVLISDDMDVNRMKVQTGQPTWPPLSISWSFNLVFVGLLINTLSTALFLTLQLIKNELEAENARQKHHDLSNIKLSNTGF
ncbi:uncharacterized protein LOC123532300 [Mercenaria mercenaria]|uniref:uncharacterized protein LOC123532300 n=1 Tax=Mercenaria mercenaria TaxID=6596 RepID=UPI00234FA415|nr:uncharacterized protein LOC123532300 [Mercenaria mercenaria]